MADAHSDAVLRTLKRARSLSPEAPGTASSSSSSSLPEISVDVSSFVVDNMDEAVATTPAPKMLAACFTNIARNFQLVIVQGGITQVTARFFFSL